MWRKALLPIVLAALACAQDQSQTGSIAGIVRDAATDAPLQGVRVSIAGNSATTDAQGRFTFERIEPGSQWISASDTAHGGHAGIEVLVTAGQQSTAEIRLKLGGTIAGHVLNEDREPLAGAAVLLLDRKYEYGELAYTPTKTVAAAKDGSYRFDAVPPEQTFMILAKKPLKAVDPGDNFPADLDKRERVLLPSLYPDARDLAGAQTVTLSPGEARTGVDIRMLSAPSYCIEGDVDRAGEARQISLSVTERLSFESGWYLTPAAVTPQPDGKFRACGLHPGDYHLSTSNLQGEARMFANAQAEADVTVTDRDLRDVKVLHRTEAYIPGDVALDPPPTDNRADLSVAMVRLMKGGDGYADSTEKPPNYAVSGGLSIGDRVHASGSFTIGRFPPGDWQLNVRYLPAGCYLKEASFGNQDVLYAPLRLNQAAGGEPLHLTVACDGGTLTARVMDKDGNPVSHVTLYLMPAGAPSQGALALGLRRSTVVRSWSSPLTALPPGKYLALATGEDLDATSADQVDKLWRARGQAKEVEIGPNATVQVTLEPIELP